MNRIALLAFLVFVVAACSPSVGDAGPLAITSPAVVEGSSPTASSPPALPVVSPTPPSTAPASPSPSTPEASVAPPSTGANSIALVVYLLLDQRLVPVQRQVPATLGVARAAMTALLAGPTPELPGHAPAPRSQPCPDE